MQHLPFIPFQQYQEFNIPTKAVCFYRTQVSLGSDLWVMISLSPRRLADLTDVTLADEDSNSIPTDDVNG